RVPADLVLRLRAVEINALGGRLPGELVVLAHEGDRALALPGERLGPGELVRAAQGLDGLVEDGLRLHFHVPRLAAQDGQEHREYHAEMTLHESVSLDQERPRRGQPAPRGEPLLPGDWGASACRRTVSVGGRFGRSKSSARGSVVRPPCRNRLARNQLTKGRG